MHRRILSLVILGFIGMSIFDWGCTKLDTTKLGGDLIPVVDNITTFDTILTINAVQGEYSDSTFPFNTDEHALGHIETDPLFGKTTGDVYMQLKPNLFPYSLGDSIVQMDSVVLCLYYKGYWGDSNVVQTLQAFEVVDNEFKDSVFKNWLVNENSPVVGSEISDPKAVDIRRLGDSVKIGNLGFSVTDQIRIKLKEPYASRLFYSDSMSMGTGNHAFNNDSLFRENFNGIAVKAVSGGNALMYVNLSDTNTRIELHYRRINDGKVDTTYKTFVLSTDEFGTVLRRSSTANHIKRDRSGTPSANPGINNIYLQTLPGTFASLQIPGLSTLTNRVVHRAEIIIEEDTFDPISDTLFSPPNYIYLDLKDTAAGIPQRYKPIYHDLNPNTLYDPDYTTGLPFFPTGGTDYGYFGGYNRKKIGPLGNLISYYNINISRYVQRLLITGGTNYEMRLFAPFHFHYPQYSVGYLPYNNNIALGRVRVGSGTNTTYPMRLRVIYSKIN